MKQTFLLLMIIFFISQVYSVDIKFKTELWDDPGLWQKETDSKCSIKLDQTTDAEVGKVLRATYNFNKSSGWAGLKKTINIKFDKKQPLTFYIKTTSNNDLEVKFEDKAGAVFEKRFSLIDKYTKWTKVVIYLNNLEYFYGGKSKNFGELRSISFSVSGQDQHGEVYFNKICLGEPGLKASFRPAGSNLDPNRYAFGIGFDQRRAKELTPEDPGVLEYLKQMQDTSSPDKKLIPSQEDSQANTFNNALVAMAFMLKDEKERAERILNFYSEATDPDNTDITLQNFFYNGEARGFFQFCYIRDESSTDITKKAYHYMYKSDRWMGDMVWLIFAYKCYEKKYKSDKYKKITKLLIDLIKSYYMEYTKDSGYIQSGWRKGDKRLHDASGHHEGNVDCYALFELIGEKELAKKIKNWLEGELKGKTNLPLDLYSWRVQAYGKNYGNLLDIPEFDFRFRKIITLPNGETVMGFYCIPEDKDNIWMDGIGHMAVAFYTVGNMERGYFYANQYDKLFIEREIDGVMTKSFPYVLDNKDPNFKWVDIESGFSSVCAWYIFAKNKFNPMRLEQY